MKKKESENNGLKIDVRRKKILEILAKDGQVRVSQLSELLGATVVTIRSDLETLEMGGYLERVPGGAIQTIKNFYNIDLYNRKKENIQYKLAIAAELAKRVDDGDALFINSGTTTYFAALELKSRKNLKVVTNSMHIAIELSTQPSFKIMLLGGETNPQYLFTYGNDAIEHLGKYRANKAILSLAGISDKAGLTTHHADEALLDKLMMERADQSIIIADYTKLGRESFARIDQVTAADYLITNSCADEAELERLQKRGLQIISC